MLPDATALEARARDSIPVLFALALVFVDLAPRPAGAGGGVAPFLTLGVIYFWSLYRPDLMTYSAVFVIGLIYDVLSGMPLGITAFAFLLGRVVLIARQRFFYAKSFSVIWALFVLWAPVVELLRYGLTAAILGFFADPTALVVQCGLTIALYPALSWILVRLHAQVRIPAYAES